MNLSESETLPAQSSVAEGLRGAGLPYFVSLRFLSTCKLSTESVIVSLCRLNGPGWNRTSAVVFGEKPKDLFFEYNYDATLMKATLQELLTFWNENGFGDDCKEKALLTDSLPVFRIGSVKPVPYSGTVSLLPEGVLPEDVLEKDCVGGPFVSRANLTHVAMLHCSTKRNNRRRQKFGGIVFGFMPVNTPSDQLFDFGFDAKFERSSWEELATFYNDKFGGDYDSSSDDDSCTPLPRRRLVGYMKERFPNVESVFRINQFDPVLYNVHLRLSREGIVFNKNWSGKMVAKANLDDFPDYSDSEEEETESAEHSDSDEKGGFGGPVLAKARLTVLGKRDSKKKHKIIFGESPLKMICDFSYCAQVERCTFDELVAFYKENFGENGQYAFNLSSAYRAKKTSSMDDNFFVVETRQRDKNGKEKVAKKDLRDDPEALFKARFYSEIYGTNGLPDIFRIVRFSHICFDDAFPQTMASIRRRFPASVIGMDEKHYKDWIELMKQQLQSSRLGKIGEQYKLSMMACRKLKQNNGSKGELLRADSKLSKVSEEMRLATAPFYQTRAVLDSLEKRSFRTNLDKRLMKDHLRFFATCPEYWKVGRDFPTHVMDYMLKPCERRVGCTVCAEMLKFHRQNLLDGAIDRILYPESPFLRRKGKLPFSHNLISCAEKWKLCARFPKLAKKFPQTAIQRALLFKELIDLRMRRARTTTFDLEKRKDQFDLMTGSTGPVYLFHNNCLEEKSASGLFFLDHSEPLPDTVDEVQDALLRFLLDDMKGESIVRVDNLEFALAYDVERELKLYFHLRHKSTKVYENLLPSRCSKIIFPNPNLKKILPEEYRYHKNGPVCLAFARRWRTRDLLREIEKLRGEQMPFFLHVDTKSSSFVFDPREDIQDWFSFIYRKEKVRIGSQLQETETSEHGPTPLPSITDEDNSIHISMKGVDTIAKKQVSSTDDLKEMMEWAVEGKCYIVCNSEWKRKFLLKQSEGFRNGPNRKVLYRGFPYLSNSVYNLMVKAFKDLDGQEEATITLPTRMSIFCPRELVFCVGDNWIKERRELANHLAKKNGKVFELELKGDQDFNEEFKFWQYNDKPVQYGEKKIKKKPWSDVPFNGSSFFAIHKFVDMCMKNFERLRSETRQGANKEQRLEHLRLMAKEQERKRAEKLENQREDRLKKQREKRELELAKERDLNITNAKRARLSASGKFVEL